MGNKQRGKQNEVEEQQYENVYVVEFDAEREQYKINKEIHNTHTKSISIRKDSNQLFKLNVNNTQNDEFCWAVFKKKTVRNSYCIKTKGYWEIIENENDDKRAETRREEKKELEKKLETQISFVNIDDHLNAKKYRKKKRFKYILLSELNIIFELLQIHYMHSLKDDKEKKKIAKKNPTLVSSPLYRDYCLENKRAVKAKEYRIKIGFKLYRLRFWNAKGRMNCNAISICICDEEREYFYMRFKYKVKSMIWDWYDNDAAKYNRSDPGEHHEVYKELEATYQSNLNSNFPQQFWNPLDNTKHMFDVCVLPQLKRFLETKVGLKVQALLLRFTYTVTKNKILNIERLTVKRNQMPFPRNVRRIINNKNSLFTYLDVVLDGYIRKYIQPFLAINVIIPISVVEICCGYLY